MTKPIVDQGAAHPSRREAYEPMTLVELGSVAEMTRGGSHVSAVPDTLNASNSV